MANPVGAEERARIVALLRSDLSPYAVAKKCGRSRPTVSKIAREEGIELNVKATKKAAEARRDYAQAERLLLLNEGFDKARDVLSGIATPDDLKDWSVAVGTLIDKRRLEDGEATTRSEQVDPERRRKMRESLDDLAARRRERLAG